MRCHPRRADVADHHPVHPAPPRHRTAMLPGVGPVFAARLLDHFGSLRGVLDTDAAALRAVPGVGEAIATQLAALLH